MRAFRYRLSAVLARAEHTQHLRQTDLARLQDELSEAVRRLSSLHRIQHDLHERLRDLLEGEASAPALPPGSASPAGQREPAVAIALHDLHALRRGLERVDPLLDRARHLRRVLEGRVDAARERLVEATRARQLLENHRDDLARHHRRAELTEETKQLDDLATRRHASGRPHPEVSQ